jgi:hypothetical protein
MSDGWSAHRIRKFEDAAILSAADLSPPDRTETRLKTSSRKEMPKENAGRTDAAASIELLRTVNRIKMKVGFLRRVHADVMTVYDLSELGVSTPTNRRRCGLAGPVHRPMQSSLRV